MGRRISPAVQVNPRRPRPIQLRGSTTPVPVDQFLSGQSLGSFVRLCSVAGFSQSASRPANRPAVLADGIDAVHRTAKVIHCVYTQRSTTPSLSSSSSSMAHDSAPLICSTYSPRASLATDLVSRLLRMRKVVAADDALRRAFRRLLPPPPTLLASSLLTSGVFIEVVGRAKPRRDL